MRRPRSDETLAFWVEGVPVTAGSKRAFPFRRADGKLGVRVAHDSPKTRPWMSLVNTRALQAMVEAGLDLEADMAIGLTLRFFFMRPKSHFGANGLKASSPSSHTQKPDLDKLERAVQDAMTGVVYRDDSQIRCKVGEKNWSEKYSGVEIIIRFG